MRKREFIVCLMTFLLATASAVSAKTIGPGFGKSMLFNDNWLFSLADSQSFKEVNLDDSQWRKLSLPHDWSVEGQLSQQNASCTGYLPAGIAWYRKHFQFKPDSEYPLNFIYFEGVYNRSEVYLNGHLLGKRPNGYVSFLYDMTPYLKNGDNVLAVRVDHSRNADSRWYTGSGIYRDVYMVSSPKTHLALWGTTYRLNSLNDGNAVVEVDVKLERDKAEKRQLSANIEICDGKGNVVVRKSEAIADDVQHASTFQLTVPNPKLWSIEDPYLYQLHVQLMADGKAVDGMTTSMGLRTLDFNANTGFALNGQNMKVKGVCLHHDAGVLGAAVPEQVWRRRVRELKKMGANAIRMSHNIQAPILYDICDELGMLVMDEGSDEWEFPKRKWITGWNNGEPGYDGTFDFFEEWIDRDVQDMVLRDRNHPCIFLWSVGNEVDYPNDPYSHPILDGTTINQPMFGGYKKDAPNAERIGFIAKRLAEVIRANDKSRPVTGALAGVVMSNQTIYPEVIDVVGYNYTENRYKEDHQTYPDRIIYGSETSTDYNAWKAVRDNDFIFGQFVWTGTDYLGESGRWPSRGLNTGLLNFGSFKKARGWFRASLWSEEPVAYLGTYPIRNQNRPGGQEGRRGRGRGDFFSIDAADNWNYQEGMTIRVVCYTNQPKARLFVNEELVDSVKTYDDRHGMIYWDVPYKPGFVRVEAISEYDVVKARYMIYTDRQPTQLLADDLTAEGLESLDEAADATLLQILVKIADEDCNIIKSASNEITCLVDGGAELLGLEASNNSDMSDYTDNKHNAFRGTLLAYIRKKDSKPVNITFSSPGITPITIKR